MEIFTYPLFWTAYGLSALFATLAGLIPPRWGRLVQVLVILLSVLSASLFYLYRFVSWLFDLGREPLMPLVWLFEIVLPAACFFVIARLLRWRFTQSVATRSI
jgi:hypothetical protein